MRLKKQANELSRSKNLTHPLPFKVLCLDKPGQDEGLVNLMHWQYIRKHLASGGKLNSEGGIVPPTATFHPVRASLARTLSDSLQGRNHLLFTNQILDLHTLFFSIPMYSHGCHGRCCLSRTGPAYLCQSFLSDIDFHWG
jgi:hypothetical protein